MYERTALQLIVAALGRRGINAADSPRLDTIVSIDNNIVGLMEIFERIDTFRNGLSV